MSMTVTGRRSAADQVPARHRRPVRRTLRALLIAAVAVLALALGAVAVLWPLTPSVADAGTRVDRLLATHGDHPLAALPADDRVGRAVVATEDQRFFSHHGIDPTALLRVMWSAVRGGSADAGGATLDQQLAKTLYAPGPGGLAGKVEQVELALKLDHHYPKQQLLRMYLSAVYFGHGYYGLPAAAAGYFGRSPAALDWGQASLLAGLVQAPSAYDPLTHLARARARERHVLDRLVATGVLTRGQAAAAYAAPLHLEGSP